ncbi:hypothetical protein [Flavobacterium sp.]|uniref:hypothetical protein n=1 Tax=Flavobacterium sp. TaxID=239 RepID=UPI002FDA13E8
MTEFNEIQDLWNLQNQSKLNLDAAELIAKSEKNSKILRRNHYGTLAIISVTTLILVYYFFWVNAHHLNAMTLGLSIMIVMLLSRIVLELHSVQKLKAIHPDLTVLEYAKKVKTFYQWRRKIHYVFTPLIYITYFIGFTLLLPTFKAHFSFGFYLYCIVSGYGFFLLFGYFLMKHIQKELQILEKLNPIK